MISENESFNLKKPLLRILNLWPWFLLSLAFSLSLTYIYLHRAQPVYKAVAALMVRDDSKGVSAEVTKMKEIGLINNSKLVVNEIEVLKSYDLLARVVDTLQLFSSIKKADKFQDIDVYKTDVPFRLDFKNPATISKVRNWTIFYKNNTAFFKSESDGKPVQLVDGQEYTSGGIIFRYQQNKEFSETNVFHSGKAQLTYYITLRPLNDVIIDYGKKLIVEQTNKYSTVIDLEINDTHSLRAKDFLQTLLDIYKQQQFETKNKNTENAIVFLNDRLIEVASALKNMEGNVEKFKSANKVTSLSNDAQKYLESSQQVDQQKAQIQTQLNIIEALEQNLQLNKSNPKIIPSTYGVQDQLLNKLVERYNELVLENEKLQQVSGPKNPLVIELLDQINELRGKLSTSVDNLKRAYSISLNDIAFKDDQLSNQIRNVPLLEKRLIQITRSQNVQENLYAYLLQKREEAAVAKASTVEDFQIIVNARELGMVAPNKNIILTVGILAGLLLPVFFATARDLLNNKIGDAYQIEQSTSFPIIGTISHVRKLTTPIVVDNQLRSVAADQIRNLRTSIYLLNQRKAIKTMMLTSYQSGDGKSFVSLNLAASYALLDKKTVMIEFDLRCPDISKKYGLEDNLGISDVLSGSTSIQDVLVVVPEFNSNLFILPAGNAVMNPTELLSGSEMHKLMHTLQKQFDYIIIDTPPINLFADYSLLQQFSDVTLVVLRQDYTSRDVYNELRHLETKYPNDLIYLVLNDTGKRKKYRDPYSSYKNKLAKKYYSKISGNL